MAPYPLSKKLSKAPLKSLTEITFGPIYDFAMVPYFHLKKEEQKVNVIHDPVTEYYEMIFGSVEILLSSAK